MIPDTNRRGSFRMDDDVLLRIRLPDDAQLEEIERDFNYYRIQYCLKSRILNQQQDLVPRLTQIRRKDSDVADYLDQLQCQIVSLAERMDTTFESDNNEAMTRVNLSATGIRFRTEQDLRLHQRVEIGLFLSTSDVQVVALADVVRLEPVQTERGQLASLNYTSIHPDDSEAIIRHLAKLQTLELQARRQG